MKRIIIVALGVMLLQNSFAQIKVDRSKKPVAGPAPVISIKDPVIFNLSNGMTILVVENHKVPKVRAILNIDAGVIKEGSKAGVMDLMGQMLGEGTTTMDKSKFDESVDIAVRLGVDPRKANQMVRGVVALPHGTGKDVKVLALVTPDKEAEAKAAGADYVGLDDYLQKIKDGWTDVDVIITMPAVMGKLGPLGRILGPRGLMPNPKTGTVTMEIGKAVAEVKAGKIDFKVDKTGIVHAGIGRISFDADKIVENANEIIQTLIKLKPTAAKGTYIKSIYLTSTMSPAIALDPKAI